MTKHVTVFDNFFLDEITRYRLVYDAKCNESWWHGLDWVGMFSGYDVGIRNSLYAMLNLPIWYTVLWRFALEWLINRSRWLRYLYNVYDGYLSCVSIYVRTFFSRRPILKIQIRTGNENIRCVRSWSDTN